MGEAFFLPGKERTIGEAVIRRGTDNQDADKRRLHEGMAAKQPGQTRRDRQQTAGVLL